MILLAGIIYTMFPILLLIYEKTEVSINILIFYKSIIDFLKYFLDVKKQHHNQLIEETF